MLRFEEFKTKEELINYLKTTKDISCQTTKQAEKYIAEHLPKEAHFQKKIIEQIKAMFPAAFVWKAAAGAYGRGGIPDVCAIIDGKYYGFEVKRPFIGVPTKLQLQTIKQIQAAGGRAYIVSWPSEVERILRREAEGGG